MSDYGSDYEHGWNIWPFHGQNIMTCVRDQGSRPTCIFHALCAAYEIDFRRLLALEGKSTSTDFQFNVESFIKEFEELYGVLGTDTPFARLQNAIRLLQDRGVLATSSVWPDEQVRVTLAGCQEHPGISFEDVEAILEEGRPLIGGFTILENDNFQRLGRNEIYSLDRTTAALGTYNHLVVFIGSGSRGKKGYLRFLNSEGKGFGDGGYGSVWFDEAKVFHTIDLEGELQPPPPPPPPPAPLPPPSHKRSTPDSSSSSTNNPTIASSIWKSDPRKKRYRSNRSNQGGSDALADKTNTGFISGSLEDVKSNNATHGANKLSTPMCAALPSSELKANEGPNSPKRPNDSEENDSSGDKNSKGENRPLDTLLNLNTIEGKTDIEKPYVGNKNVVLIRNVATPRPAMKISTNDADKTKLSTGYVCSSCNKSFHSYMALLCSLISKRGMVPLDDQISCQICFVTVADGIPLRC